MQEAYFKARKMKVQDELYGNDVDDSKMSAKANSVSATPAKPNKSKQTLMKILEEDKGSSSSSKLPRSKSGFLMPYK